MNKKDNIKIGTRGSKLDGSRIIKDIQRGPCEEPEKLGKSLAEKMLNMGADKILAEVYGRPIVSVI